MILIEPEAVISVADIIDAAHLRRAVGPDSIAADFKMAGREFVFTRAAANLNRYDYKKLELSFSALLVSTAEIRLFSSETITLSFALS